MQEFATYKNKYNGKIAKYLRYEAVANYPKPISVHVVLIDDKEDRWDSDSFFKSWDLVGWYA